MDFEKYKTNDRINELRKGISWLRSRCFDMCGENCPKGVLRQIKADIKKLKLDIYAEEALLKVEFKKDLLKELDVTSNPKADLLFEKAWSLGHSSGFEEVYSFACDLVELIA